MFFDNASTTIIDKEIMNQLDMVNEKYFYNPGGLYENGRKSRAFLEMCRNNVYSAINASGDDDIVFTGSATEANNLALFGLLKKNTRKILVSQGEHPSIYNVALEMKQRGYDVDFVSLTAGGCVDFEDFKNKMTDDVDIVSIMLVSNETGAINDVSNLVEYAKSINPKCIFHCDAVQGVGKIKVDVDELGVDMLTMSAHKIHGCKGVGALYIRKGVKLKPVVYGGGQENGLRSGTENLLGIFTLSEALRIACTNLENNYNYVLELKKLFLNKLSDFNLEYVVHSLDCNSPYIVSLSFLGCRAETLLNMLSDKGVCVGNGSACSSKKSGNRILESMGRSKAEIESNLRISFSKYNTLDEVALLVEKINECVSAYLDKVR
ncbi:MAG: cysteine desulfurase [Clostridia bacterium]|nr:cysteine desulfurase [Clostridia bacterium]